MSTTRIDLPANDSSSPTPVATASTRTPGGHCGNCGFEDSGHYCSRCGEPLHGTRDTVPQILWADLVEGPVHNGFALAKTTWLMLVRPRRFFDGVLRRQHGMTHVPFFLSPLWRRMSHKPHGVPNAVKYFVLIYTLAVLGGWALGREVFPQIPVFFRGENATLPDLIADPLFLAFVVFAAWMYSRAVSMLLGGKIETQLLTRFMLYLNGFALIPFMGMSVTSARYPWLFYGCLVFWLYVLFLLPQMSLPRIFGISRARLGFAQAGAAVVNGLVVVVAIFAAGVVADVLMPNWNPPDALMTTTPATTAESGISALRRAAAVNVFPLDTLISQLPHAPAGGQRRPAQAHVPARHPPRHAR